ncbi:uncharacterized protein LTR77_010698 [Saxophila tyrrhenica]|uniref:EGF-like domain-containing protein n=1 Tax=Saxophila tyrrhenica TaxID=1690608 RepID=A0AAV9NUP5_9PEZI|nr:hypothetical protein LTR77_010698 [Saxophila tyrrhenica]
MSYQYYDRGMPHGGQEYDMRPPPGRRPPPPGNFYPPSDRQRGPPPMRPPHPNAGPPPGMRKPVRPPPPRDYAPPQNYAPPPRDYARDYAPSPELESADSLYDGTAYGGADPGASPRGSPRRAPQPPPVPSNSSPRRPPQRPARPDYPEQVLDPPRPAARIAPANQAYHQPPPQPLSYHGTGQWTGDGYRSPQQPLPAPPQQPRCPPPPQPSSIPDYQMPQALQQTIYGQRNQRPPLGPPPSSRKGPASYYPQIAQVHPIVEETDSMRGSIRNASAAFDPAHSSYGSLTAIPIGIPGYYVEDRGSARSLPFEQHGRPSVEHGRPSVDHGRPSMEHMRPSMDQGYDDSHIEPIRETSSDGRYMYDGVESPSPEPAQFIRQASLGKKSKPTLTHVKSSERVRKENAAPNAQRPARPTTTQTSSSGVLEKETYHRRSSVSSISSDEEDNDKAVEAGAMAVPAVPALAVPSKTKNQPTRQWSAESDVLSSGTGLIGPSSSESDSEQAIKKKRSQELLTAVLPQAQLNRSQPRSPLAPPSPTADPIRKSVSPAPTEPDYLSRHSASNRLDKRRPPRLDVDAVRDAEARGSLTSLPDLIRRATKVAGNLDRGRTASRLGMNFFVDGAEGDNRRSRASDNRKSGDISDILASFPPPSGRFGSPPGSRGGVSLSRWSSNLRHSHLPSDSDAGEAARRRKKGRRCCGMPMWLFVLLLILLLLLVAAAVLVPILLLIVLPGDSDDTTGNGAAPGSITAAHAAEAVKSCAAELTCANNGATILSEDGFCQCVCTDGFTGQTCKTKAQQGCTTISVSSTDDATIGTALPAFLENSEKDFGITLDAETLLGLFSSADMRCQDENQLVSFTTANNEQQRQSKRSSSSAASSSSSASSSSNSDPTLEFAGAAVLYIFQDSAEPAMAVTAHQRLQAYFQNGKASAAGEVDLGNGYSADMGNGRLRPANGKAVGDA